MLASPPNDCWVSTPNGGTQFRERDVEAIAVLGMKRPSALALGLALMLAIAAPAASARPSHWELGTLTCSLAKETSVAPGGLGREAICQFRPGDRGPEETYVGTIQFVGRDGALTGGGTVMMIVKAPEASQIVAGLLEQTYTAEVSSGKQGAKQAALVGQKDQSIILHSASRSEPLMALGQRTPPLIIGLELKLRSSPA